MKKISKNTILVSLILLAAVGAGGYALIHKSPPAAAPVKQTVVKTPPVATPTPPAPAATFSKTQYSLTDPTSIWIVVNKQQPLTPLSYAPSDLVVPKVPTRVAGMQVRRATATALESMFAAAQKDGAAMKLSSGYRSYTYQVNLYNGYVKTQGQAVADTQSARPGYSEHQSGLAADVGPLNGNCNVQQCFANTTAGKWLAANAYKYGFIIRYGNGLDATTGYTYEPWHVRYVGIDLATEMHNKNVLTLEQYFDLGAAPGY